MEVLCADDVEVIGVIEVLCVDDVELIEVLCVDDMEVVEVPWYECVNEF